MRTNRKPKFPPVKIHPLQYILNDARNQRGMSWEEFGEKVGMTAGAAANKAHRGVEAFRVRELLEWAAVLGVDSDALVWGITQEYENVLKSRKLR